MHAYVYIYIYWGTQFHKTDTGHKGRNRSQYNNSGDFNTLVLPMEKSSRQKKNNNNKERSELNCTIGHWT
jgi:hypothetical protein